MYQRNSAISLIIDVRTDCYIFFILDKNQDQLATIIHRGRDHGLPTYTQVRESCGLLPVTTFEELNNTVDTKTIEALQQTYQVN